MPARCRVCGGKVPKFKKLYCSMDCSEIHRKKYRAEWYKRVQSGEHQPQRRQGARKLTEDDGLDEVRLELFGYALALHGCVRPSPGTVRALKPEAKKEVLDMVEAAEKMTAGGWKRHG